MTAHWETVPSVTFQNFHFILSYNGAQPAHEANSTDHSQGKSSAFVIYFLVLKKRVTSVVVTFNGCNQWDFPIQKTPCMESHHGRRSLCLVTTRAMEVWSPWCLFQAQISASSLFVSYFSALLCKILYQRQITQTVSEKKNGTYISTKEPRELLWAEMSWPCGHNVSIPSSSKIDSIACSQSTLMSYV